PEHDIDLGAGVPDRSVADAQREMIHAVRGEGLKRLRHGLPDLTAADKPGLPGAETLWRVAREVRAQKDRAADPAPHGRRRARHEIARQIRLERVRESIKGDAVGCGTRVGRYRRR